MSPCCILTGVEVPEKKNQDSGLLLKEVFFIFHWWSHGYLGPVSFIILCK